MKRTRRLIAYGAAGLLFAAAVAPQAHAAPPLNDEIASATVVPSIPATFQQDISQATSRQSDGTCVGGQSVWFRYRPTTTQKATRVTTVGSDYDTMLTVFRGPSDRRTLVACNDDRIGLMSGVTLDFVKGKRYWIAVSRCCSRPSSRPGQAVLNLFQPDALDIAVTVRSVEAGLLSGRLLISGTAVCSNPSVVWIRTRVSQRVGDAVARGVSRKFLPRCTDEPTVWTSTVDSSTGWAFQEGSAILDQTARGFDGFTGANDDIEMTPWDIGENLTGRAGR